MKLKEASKFKKYFDQHCYVACLETLFTRLSRIHVPVYKLFYTTPYEVVSPGLSKRKFTVLIVCQLSCNASDY